MQYDYLIKKCNLYGDGNRIQRDIDVAMKGGIITKVGRNLECKNAKTVIDAKDKLLSPGFVDSHMHVDKAFWANDDDTTDLLSAIKCSFAKSMKKYSGMTREEIYQDIYQRAEKVLKMCIVNGTTAIKNTVQLDEIIGMTALDVMFDLKKKYADKLDIYNVVPYDESFSKEWEEAYYKGKIDFVGGYPDSGYNKDTNEFIYISDGRPTIDKAFFLAEKYHLPIDLHINESDKPNIDSFLYVIHKTLETQMQGRVTCGHVTSISAPGIDPDVTATAISACAKACVNVTSLTSCNMYLMDWGRRGPTKVREMMDAGVNVSIASDNIRDAFRPFGDGDLLKEALLTAQVHKYMTHSGFAQVFQMITYNPALNSLMENYGTLEGAQADLVLLDAPDMTEAILSHPKKLYVFKKGEVVAECGKIVSR